jgi:hypothetical protein
MCNWTDTCYFIGWSGEEKFQVGGTISRRAIAMILAISNVGIEKMLSHFLTQ